MLTSVRMAAPESTRRWPYGSMEDRIGDLPVALRDPGGVCAWWCRLGEGGAIEEAGFRLPSARVVEIGPGPPHPVLGDTLEVATGNRALARFSRVSLTDPDRIPAMDRPGALPPGAGTAILGFLAARAEAMGRSALRYHGPYPTAALFDALADAYRVRGDLRQALATFVADVETRAAEGRTGDVPVDFEPAPFERHFPAADVCVQLREGLEKVFLGARAYDRAGSGGRRLERRGGGYAAVFEIAGEPYFELARFDEGGRLLSGPQAPPAVESPLSGRALPSEVGRALADALPERAPVLLRDALRDTLLETPLVWGDPGTDGVASRDGAFIVHAALADRLEGKELLEAIARAVELPAQRLAQARLERAVGP